MRQNKKSCKECGGKIPSQNFRTFCSNMCSTINSNKEANEKWLKKENKPIKRKIIDHQVPYARKKDMLEMLIEVTE